MATARALNTVIYALMGTYPDVQDIETFTINELGETVNVCRQWGIDRMVVRAGHMHIASHREPVDPYLFASQKTYRQEYSEAA